MSWGLTAVAGASLVSGYMGSQAASNAADAQAAAAGDSNALQKYIFDQQRADALPFLNNGTAANNKLAQLLGILPQYDPRNPFTDPAANAEVDRLMGRDGSSREQAIAQVKAGWNAQYAPVAPGENFGAMMKPITQADIEADPVYSMGLQFGLDEGTKGINRQAAATGNLLSGATLKALTKYGNDYASTKANDAVNRIGAQRQQQYSMLSGLSGGGQAASGQTGAAAQNYGNNVSATTQSLGNARGASAIAGSNAWTGAINGGMSAYQGNQLLQAMRGGGGGYTGTIDPWNGNFYQQNGSGGGF